MVHVVLPDEEVLRLLDALHRDHQRLLHHAADIRAAEPVRLRRQVRVVLIRQRVALLPEVDAEHRATRLLVRQRDVDSLLETAADGRVQLPRLRVTPPQRRHHVGRAQHQHARLVLAHAVHLHQKLVQHLALAAAAVAALRVRGIR